jgi:drug/metabolite transporter (DMT)-like permease
VGRGGDLLLSPALVKGSPSDNLPLGAVLMVTASFFFALMASFVQLASERLPESMVVFARNGIALLFIAPLALRGGWQGLRSLRLREHLGRTAAGLTSMYCFFYAIHRLRLADAVLLQYTVPLFLPLVEGVWLKQRVDRRVWGPLLLGFAGVLFVIEPGRGLFQVAALVGLAAGLMAAIAQTGIRRLTSTEPTTRIIFYFSFFSTLVSSVPAATFWVTPGKAELGVFVLLGVCATLAQFAMTRAYAHAPAAQVGAFVYSSVPFAMLFDWVRRGKPPDLGSCLGALLIGGAGVFMLRLHRAPPAAPAEP